MRKFQDLQIIEITGSQAGAFTAKMFAYYGAKVLKVEPIDGDPLRSAGEAWGGIGSEFAYLNTSKQAVCLDLDSESGQADLASLVDLADAVIESSAPDPLTPVTADMGDDQLVRVYVSPFGLSGPYASYRSNVFTDDAIGGHMGLSGEPDREPLQRAGLHTHFQAGMHAFIGCLASLLARERTGSGQSAEISHMEGMASLHQHTTSMWTHGQHIIHREGNAQAGPWHPAGVYPCKDGYIFLGHALGPKLIPFVEVLGYGHLFEDPRFATDGARGAHKREFDEALTVRLMELTAEEITDFGRAVFSPIGPVPTMLEVLEDEQFEAREYWREIPGDPPAKIPRGPFVIDEHPSEPRPAPAQLGSSSLDSITAEWTKNEASASRESLQDGPLQGVRVLDLTRVWAGPIGARILADLGADVIHVEAPWNRGLQILDPDMAALTRLYPNNEVGERPWNRASGFNKLARNKRSVTLNLQFERGLEVFAELVKNADVVFENYSPRVMPQLGFDFESLKKLNPSIVYVAMPGYGSSGPGQDRVALGPVIEAAVGLTAMMGYRDSGPYRSGVAWSDPVAGISAVAGTLIALWDRAASGGAAQHVESAMSESMATFAGEELLAAQVRGTNAPRLGNRDANLAPQGAYPCAGFDRWVAISITTDDEWRALCDAASLGSELAGLDRNARHKRHDEIDEAISRWTTARGPYQAMHVLQSHGVIAAAVADGRDLVEDPQLEARNFWAECQNPDVGLKRYPGNPIKLRGTPLTFRYPPPGLGEHNDEVYRGILGMSEEELAELRADKIVVDLPPASLEELASSKRIGGAYG